MRAAPLAAEPDAATCVRRAFRGAISRLTGAKAGCVCRTRGNSSTHYDIARCQTMANHRSAWRCDPVTMPPGTLGTVFGTVLGTVLGTVFGNANFRYNAQTFYELDSLNVYPSVDPAKEPTDVNWRRATVYERCGALSRKLALVPLHPSVSGVCLPPAPRIV